MENKTFNILRVQAIYSQPVNDAFFIANIVVMTAVLELHCQHSGTMPSRIKIKSRSHEVSTMNEGLRQAIENFLNGRSEVEHEFFDVEGESIGHLGINKIKIELEEPLRSEFEKIFNASNWQNIQLKIN